MNIAGRHAITLGPGPAEARRFLFNDIRKGQGFDRLGPNGNKAKMRKSI